MDCNVKNIDTGHRLTVFVGAKDLRKWRTRFAAYGSKTLFEAETGITRQTLHKILNEGKGEQRIVDTIKSYVSNSAA